MTRRVELRLSLRLPIELKQERRSWIASCPALDVVTQGQTKEEATTNIEDALVFFFESCVRRDTLFQVLKEAGFELREESDNSLWTDADEEQSVCVELPMPFVIAQHSRDQQAHRDRPL